MEETTDFRAWILKHRGIPVALVNVLLSGLAFYAAFALRLDTFAPWDRLYGRFFFTALFVAIGVRFLTFLAFDLFKGMWRYVSIPDLMNILQAVSLGSVLIAPVVIFALAGGKDYSGSIFVLDWAFCILLTGGVRFAIRAFRETFSPEREGGRKVLIVGAGDGGEMLLREMRTHQHLAYRPVGFVDDDQTKLGREIHGVKVLGPVAAVPRLVEREGVDEIVVAIPSASGRQMQKILDSCQGTRARLRRLPSEQDIIRLTKIRDVDVVDLLSRDPVQLDEARLRSELSGSRILITGAGGSIGSEIVRQVAGYHPEHIHLLDWSENSLFFLERELLDGFPDLDFTLCIADIKDAERIEGIFSEGGFRYVFHAAAFKHVPLMEANPLEAVKNNILGTSVLARSARRHGVQKFVLISSDKAVRPTSVMGATKRGAEILLSATPKDGTQFLSVRFGNVLGSRGSVIPLFKKQIKDGGPITVTHPDVVRYFMTIPEAVQLVLQAGAMGKGGEIFLLDMGEQVKIVDLARNLITLSGFRPDEDIAIRFIGLRPGEKLYEELLVEADGVTKSEHEKIWVLNGDAPEPDLTMRRITALLDSAGRADLDSMIRDLKELVPEYEPNNPRFTEILGGACVEEGE
jgi:FlaA1/EpsC-like NDP-sugar epimerase